MRLSTACLYSTKTLSKLTWFPPLLSRFILAGVFIRTGWGKIHDIPYVVNFFTSLGLSHPIFQAHLVAYSEFICGVFLLLGFIARFAACPLSIIMLVALFTAHKSDIHNFSDLFSLAPFLYLVLCLWLIIVGSGKVSFDYFLFLRRRCVKSI